MSEPNRISTELLRKFLAGMLADPESALIEDLLARNAIPEEVLRPLESDDTVTEALRAQATVHEQYTEEATVAELTQRIRALRCEPASETRLFEERRSYPFLRPAQEPGEIGRLGPYRILAVLGEGGMGVVFRAEETALERVVALKVIQPERASDPEARERFLREARVAAALSHDHIVPIFHVGEDGEVLYLVMPLLKGESLADRLAREVALPAAEALRIGREAASALAAAHRRGLIHRDVKPGNIWLESPGGRVKLLDFGLAMPDRGSQLTRAGTVAGTPSYMAPEQARGRSEPRSDLFSLGCVLYRMATGESPFEGKNVLDVLTNLATRNPRPPSKVRAGLPAGLSRLIERLLAKEPHHRPQTADQLILEIEAIERNLAACSEETAPQSSWSSILVRGASIALATSAAVLFCFLIVRITRPDGTVQQIQVPAGSTVEVIDSGKLIAGNSSPTSAVPKPVAEWIVDDGDSGYSEMGQGWKTGTKLKGGYQGDYRYNEAGALSVRWTIDALPSNSYEVFLTWLPHVNRAFHVPVTVLDGPTVLRTVIVDQREAPEDEQARGCGWRSLGVYRISNGTLAVELDAVHSQADATKVDGASVSVDAVRVVAQPATTDAIPNSDGTGEEPS